MSTFPKEKIIQDVVFVPRVKLEIPLLLVIFDIDNRSNKRQYSEASHFFSSYFRNNINNGWNEIVSVTCQFQVTQLKKTFHSSSIQKSNLNKKLTFFFTRSTFRWWELFDTNQYVKWFYYIQTLFDNKVYNGIDILRFMCMWQLSNGTVYNCWFNVLFYLLR